MTKDTYKRFIIFSLVIIFTIMSIMAIVIAGNVLHDEKCNIRNCPLCNLINLLSDFIENILLINIDILILTATVFLAQLVNRSIKKERKLTLVELKVVQNK